ncbi:MAG: adenylosuccinate synthetase, partial [Candidatus Marinimicrobia bacterium]|nr:adenylosuccinate synthetase [Candidatus Neomarinimicrobiota bacterium]
GRIQLAYNAHIVTPIHKAMDRATGGVIGTTQRGIGPAYSDKARRWGIRAVDLRDLKKIGKFILDRLKISVQQGEVDSSTLGELKPEIESFLLAANRVVPLLDDTIGSLQGALTAKKNVLIEGAQGVLLDIDLGTYPYVTSSHPTVGGISSGLGIPSQLIDRLIGVFKAYATRVGAGPFPTELDDKTGERLRETGAEYGATTGRPRRCGWFDAAAARYACQINGFTEIALTKLDVLDDFETIRVATNYHLQKDKVASFSTVAHTLELVEPIYEEHPGWQSSLSQLTSAGQLPENAKKYIDRLEELTGVPIKQVSIGAERTQTLIR